MLNYEKVPVPYMVDGLKRYVEHGIEPGSFLTAVLCNDLKGAVANADALNEKNLAEWVVFCSNELPANIWGSKERVRDHIAACRYARPKGELK